VADIVWTDVTDAITTLPTVPTALQTLILATVNGRVDGDVFDGEDGDITKYARVLLAAHLSVLTTRAATGAAGPVTSQSAGGLSRSYGTWSSPSSFSLTPHGTALSWLIQTSAARAPFLALGTE
jgi:hypothetical protein